MIPLVHPSFVVVQHPHCHIEAETVDPNAWDSEQENQGRKFIQDQQLEQVNMAGSGKLST